MTDTEIKPRFEVHPLDEEVDREKYVKDKDGKFIKKTFKEPGGFMVYFPNGASMRVRTQEELVRLGFAEPAPLVDMTTGEIIPQPQADALRRRSEQMTSSRRTNI